MGMMSVRVAEDMMTAQAWTPHWRVMPSSPLARSTIFWASGILGMELAELLGLPIALVVGVEDALDGDVLALDRRGHGLGEAVTDGVGVAHDAAGVLQGLLALMTP